MSENDAALDPASTPKPTDLQLPPEGTGVAAPPSPPDLGLPPRSLVQEPRWPHPNFYWALLWCLLFEIVTQVPGSFVIGIIAAALALVGTEQFHLDLNNLNNLNLDKLYQSDAMSVALAVGMFFTELLVIGFSLLVIRLVVGRDWMRQLAVRLPSLAHTLLALASFPALALLGNVAYLLVRESGWVPSVSDSNPFHLVFFWKAVFATLGVVVLASWLLAGFGWTRKLAVRPARTADLLLVLATLLILVPGIIGVYGLMRWTIPLPNVEMKLGGMEEIGEIFGKWPLAFTVLVIGLGPGIGEELWCRGFLGRGLVGNHGVVLGVLASSFCFGLIHVDPCQGTMAMLMGLWLHFVYLCTRSLLLPMLLHFLNNSLAVVGARLPALHRLDSKPQDIPVWIYVTSLLLLGSVVYALYQSRARLAAARPEQALLWRPAFEGVEYPPDYSGMKVVHPLPSWAAAALVFVAFVLFALACAAWFRQG
ncbi:MAG: CPBP family intramembrane glutamic endopeptidase [Gemmataceae bacterium]